MSGFCSPMENTMAYSNSGLVNAKNATVNSFNNVLIADAVDSESQPKIHANLNTPIKESGANK